MTFNRQTFKRMIGAVLGYDDRVRAVGADPNELRKRYYESYRPVTVFVETADGAVKGFRIRSDTEFCTDHPDDYSCYYVTECGTIVFNGQFYLQRYESRLRRDMLLCEQDEHPEYIVHNPEPIDLFEILCLYPVDIAELCDRCGEQNVFNAI